MNNVDFFKEPAKLAYLVKRLNESNPQKQIGKTFIQKIVYLLNMKNLFHFDYILYHYGPYSIELENELGFALNNNILNIEWKEDAGYFIKPGNRIDNYINRVPDDFQKGIDEIIDKYSKFNAQELSIIATAYFLKDNYNSSNALTKVNIIDWIAKIKPYFDKKLIEDTLKDENL